MTISKWRDMGLAFIAAVAGYAVFSASGFPAAALTGSATGVTFAALLGVQVELPVWLRNSCILVLGINIGTAVTPGALGAAFASPLSLGIMAVCILLSMVLSALVLERVFGFDRLTSVMGGSPGHLSFVLSVAAENGRDVPAIAIIQSVRVLVLTLAVPPLISVFFGATGVQVLPESIIKASHLAVLILAAVPIALLFSKLKFPAVWLLSGMAVSAVGHGVELSPGRLPDALGIAALILLGTLIGSRFSAVKPRAVLSYLLPGLFVTLIAVVVSLLGAFASVWILGLSAGLVTVAFAPGGVEAMAAIAFSLGYDPTFVAAHHVFRLLVLSVVMPTVCMRMKS